MLHLAWSQFLTGILPLIGVIVGGFITYLTQTKTLNKQLKRDIEKEKETKILERFLVYNEILNLDGEIQMQYYMGGGSTKFNLADYRDKIRPLFYSKFHLLNQDIAQAIRKMDMIIKEADFNEELKKIKIFVY